MKKRIVSMVMTVVMVLAIMPALVSGAAAATISNATGDRDWRWPVPGRSSISSYFNESRSFMLNGKLHTDVHYALDMPAAKGANVVASYGGKVTTAQTTDSGSLGKHVIIEHSYNGKTYRSIYGHMDSVSVRVNNTVSIGQVIGTVGSTGSSTGNHLHFEIRESSGARVDPFMNQFLAMPSSGIVRSTNFPSTQGYIDRVNRLYEMDISDGGGGNNGGGGGNYYPRYTGSTSSIVDALNAIGVDSSYNNRARIAAANGISNYSGTSAQNTQMLNLLKSGTLIRAGSAPATQAPVQQNTFPRYTGSSSSIVDGLRAVGADSSYNNRARIAAANNIRNYSGTAAQNTQMLNLLKSGSLLRP